MSRRICASCVATALIIVGGWMSLATRPARAAVEPSISPISWELNLRHGPLERIFVTIDGKEKTFWYMRYTVINNSNRDVLFTPVFELVADTGAVLPAFKNVPTEVFPKIKELYKNDLMLSPVNVFGKLLQGEDNARDSVVIFPDVDHDARNFSLFFGGLSGETASTPNPATGQPVILQKTLELDFNLPGQAIGIDVHSQLKAAKWVMK